MFSVSSPKVSGLDLVSALRALHSVSPLQSVLTRNDLSDLECLCLAMLLL